MKIFRSKPVKTITGKDPKLGKFTQFRLFSHNIFTAFKDYDGGSSYCFFQETRSKLLSYYSQKNGVMYLKVNRNAAYTINCLQKWIRVANLLDYAFVIVCDNPKLEKSIIKKISFENANFQIITSLKYRFRGFIRNIASPYWINAACAHLTTLYHARKHGIKKFWNIDADDIQLLINDSHLASLLKQVQKYSEINDLHLMSLDICKSKTLGRHWSWGVTFVRDNIDIFSLISNEPDNSWVKSLGLPSDGYNTDWHINHLSKTNPALKIGTFYPKEAGCIHWGESLISPIFSYVAFWRGDQTLEFPLLSAMGVEGINRIPIHSDCVPFNLNLEPNEFTNQYITEVTNINKLSNFDVELFNVRTFLQRNLNDRIH